MKRSTRRVIQAAICFAISMTALWGGFWLMSLDLAAWTRVPLIVTTTGIAGCAGLAAVFEGWQALDWWLGGL